MLLHGEVCAQRIFYTQVGKAHSSAEPALLLYLPFVFPFPSFKFPTETSMMPSHFLQEFQCPASQVVELDEWPDQTGYDDGDESAGRVMSQGEQGCHTKDWQGSPNLGVWSLEAGSLTLGWSSVGNVGTSLPSRRPFLVILEFSRPAPPGEILQDLFATLLTH